MNQFKKLNIIFGWLSFAAALVTYLLTMEPTTSFWDCGEFIASAYKLQVGHPPGAPLFAMLGRFFTLFAGGDVTKVAMMVNIMSAFVSALTIGFLFWTITALIQRIYASQSPNKIIEWDSTKLILTIGSGLIGALAYTWSDTFWFSAVEGEVYATSSLFTAVVFWAMLRWDQVADQPHADRWIVLIAYLMGLSIGVHLLNLLTIPAIGFIYYFRKRKPTAKGVLATIAISMGILIFIQYGIIPGTIRMAAAFEKMFTNGFGAGFGTGFYAYVAFVTLVVGGGIIYSMRAGKPILNLALWCVVVILIGYSSYGMIVIRSQANTPLDENNPENVYSLISYLNREQYGDRPLFYGQYYDAKVLNTEKTDDIIIKAYVVENKKGKVYGTFTIERDAKLFLESHPEKAQLQIEHRYVTNGKKFEYVYDPQRETVLPRMWSAEGSHIREYEYWGGVKRGKKPTFGNNFQFLLKYQVNWMYLRYFMWNFAGRENDMQGGGEAGRGHWISGITPIDNFFTGTPQTKLTDEMKDNKGRNRYYLLPLILGIMGMVFQFRKDDKGGWVVAMLFFLTGIAIVLYLNQTPLQPRERDYAYAGSFYAFCIWIGVGVMGAYSLLRRAMNEKGAVAVALPLCFVLVPVNMVTQNWDDHTRARRTTARDFAYNYLNSCEQNAILFTNGDNDTFPLWYLQEVEGVRTDIRIVNLSLLNTDWYITQMKRKAYEGDGVPFSMEEPQYRQGTRDQVLIDPMRNNNQYISVQDQMAFLKEAKGNTLEMRNGAALNYFKSQKFLIPVDSAAVVGSGMVPKGMEGRVGKDIRWEVKKDYIVKNEVMILDLLSNFNWKRPVYFAITVGERNYLGLEKFFQLEGMAYRLMPYETRSHDGQIGEVNTDLVYKRFMEDFRWGNMNGKGVYLDETNMRMTMNFRSNFIRLGTALATEGKNDKAIQVLDKAEELMPDNVVPYNYFSLLMADLYTTLGESEKASKILTRLIERSQQEIDYYSQYSKKSKIVQDELKRAEIIKSQSEGLMTRISAGTAGSLEREMNAPQQITTGSDSAK